MVIAPILAIISAFTGFCWPLAGFAIFFLFDSGAGGLLEKIGFLDPSLGPLQAGAVGYASAIISLFLRKSLDQVKPQQWTSITILMWVLTIIMITSRSVELGQFSTRLVWEVFYCLLWAPLFISIHKLDDKERSYLKKIVIIMSGLTAFITVLIVATDSHYLYDIFVIRSEVLEYKQRLQSARIIVHGLWTFMPLGFWFCMRELTLEHNMPKNEMYLNYSIIIFIISAIMTNLTRFLLISLVTGAIYLFITGLIFLQKEKKIKMVKVTGLLLLILLGSFIIFPEIYVGWMGRYYEAEMGGSIESRIIRNEYMYERLSSELHIFGAKDYWTYEVLSSLIVGDPHTILTIWGSYGTLASISFCLLLIVAFVKLMRIFIKRKRYSHDVIYNAIFLGAIYLQWHWMMMQGDYLLSITVFVIIFFYYELDKIGQNTGKIVTIS
jgi:hypothetical protein